MKFCTDIHDPQRRKPNDFGDPPDFSSRSTIRFTTSSNNGLIGVTNPIVSLVVLIV